MKEYILVVIVLFSFIACEKNAGEGGTSLIDGRVLYFTTSYNPQTSVNDTHYYPKAGKDVYIIYSDDEGSVYDDKFETDYNGRYHFEYLRKGDYIIYTYADSTDNSNVKYEYPIFKNISIISDNSTNTTEDFVIEENQ